VDGEGTRTGEGRADSVGTTLTRPKVLAGRYRIGPVLGRGGMGDVHLGRDLRLERDVAIKILRADLAGDAVARHRFEGEARTAAIVNHANVVTVLDVAVHDGVPFIVLEYVVGRSLADELAAGALTGERAHRVATDVLAGLAEAHRLGVLHRDVKPSNILIDGRGRAKLADFGIARLVDGSDLTETGELLGTLRYIAPERLRGARATVASDIYGVGVVLYEVLAGVKPFGDGTPVSLTYAILESKLPRLSRVRPDLDRRFAATVHRALQTDPSHRFSSADDMAAALGSSYSGRRGTSTASGAAVPTRVMQIRRHGSTGDDTKPVTVVPEADGTRRLLARRSGSGSSRNRRSLVAALIAMLAAIGAVGALSMTWATAPDATDGGTEPITVETSTPTTAPPSTTTPSSVEPPSTPVDDRNGPTAPVGGDSGRGSGRDDKSDDRKGEDDKSDDGKGDKGETAEEGEGPAGRSGTDD
jgi:serine/threonine protein kinase